MPVPASAGAGRYTAAPPSAAPRARRRADPNLPDPIQPDPMTTPTTPPPIPAGAAATDPSAWLRFVPAPALMDALGGMRLLSVDPVAGRVRAAFRVRPEFCHSGGTTAQGGFVTGWMDFTMAFSVLTRSGGTHNIASLDINVSFLERVGPGDVVAEGWVRRMGRRVAFLEASLTQEGRVCATAVSSGLLVPQAPLAPA